MKIPAIDFNVPPSDATTLAFKEWLAEKPFGFEPDQLTYPEGTQFMLWLLSAFSTGWDAALGQKPTADEEGR